MKAFFTAIKRSPKLATLVAVLVGVLVIPATLLAWGPDRTTYTMANPADHVVFNSITDNPDQGDERNFVNVREAGVGTYGDDIQLKPGKEYEVSVFYHNNASSSLNDAEHNYAGIALNSMMRVQMPASVKSGQEARITGFVSADNAQPGQVWDEAYGQASQDMDLRYVQGSAKIHTNGAINGQTLPNSLLTTGAPLGYDAFDGKVPGCNEFEGWVVFRFKTVAPDFEVDKVVSKVGSNAYSDSVLVKPGEKVEYQIEYKNTGSVNQEDVVVKDQLPAGVTYIPGTTYVANPGSNGQWVKLSSNKVVSSGINIGTYGPGSNAFVSFKAKVVDAKKLKCGLNTLVNKATVSTRDGIKSDTATVTVKKVCEGAVPSELPKTGVDQGILSIVGLSTLAGGAVYAYRSRDLLRG